MEFFEKSVEELERGRLEILRQKVAMLGIETPTHVIAELQELVKKQKIAGMDDWQDVAITLEITRNAVMIGLMRLTALEEKFKLDQDARPRRQRANDIWLACISILLLVVLFVVVFYR